MNYEIWIIYGHTKNNILLQCRCNGILYFFSWYFSLISISYKEPKFPAQLTAKCLAAVLCKACKTQLLYCQWHLGFVTAFKLWFVVPPEPPSVGPFCTELLISFLYHTTRPLPLKTSLNQKMHVISHCVNQSTPYCWYFVLWLT